MNSLGIDYGTRKIGLALGHFSVAVPIGIIATKDALSDLPKIVKDRNISVIVVGIADHMDGRVSDQTHRTRAFIKSLKKVLPEAISIVEWDERLSTFEANATLEQAGYRKEKGEMVDDIAASIILGSYLERQRHE